MLEIMLASMAFQEALKNYGHQRNHNSYASIEIAVAVSTMQEYKSALMFILLHKAQITMHLDIDAFRKNFIDMFNT